MRSKTIILIGFKNVGKSSIGLELARQMQDSFIDLDEAIEAAYTQMLSSSTEGWDPVSNQVFLDPRLRPRGLVEDDKASIGDQNIHLRSEQTKRLSCREIAQTHGEGYFRALEKSVFAETIQKKPAVLSLGGGTVMDGDNQALLKDHIVIHITAPYDLVFKRIMSNGLPSFFPVDESPHTSFYLLWEERDAVYKQLATFSIYNGSTVLAAVEKILNHNKMRESS